MASLVFKSNEIISAYDEVGNLSRSKRTQVELSSCEIEQKVIEDGFLISDTGGHCILYKHQSLIDETVETSFCLTKANDHYQVNAWNSLLTRHKKI
ncbi:MAG: hypothetical protein V7749_00825 [Cocleimonas sp.]